MPPRRHVRAGRPGFVALKCDTWGSASKVRRQGAKATGASHWQPPHGSSCKSGRAAHAPTSWLLLQLPGLQKYVTNFVLGPLRRHWAIVLCAFGVQLSTPLEHNPPPRLSEQVQFPPDLLVPGTRLADVHTSVPRKFVLEAAMIVYNM